ncbi:glutathione S-transferase C-terminal domain-containing protein, partial [Thraustotheca clavata]
AVATPPSQTPHHDHLALNEVVKTATSRQISVLLFEFGVAIHSVIIGLNLGVVSGSTFTTLLTAICFHQFFEGVAVASSAVLAFSNVKPALLTVLGYSLTTPLGIIIGIGISTTYSSTSNTSLWVQGILDAISGGVLIYTGVVELLTNEYTNNREFHSKARGKRVVTYFFVAMGSCAMSILITSVLIGWWTMNGVLPSMTWGTWIDHGDMEASKGAKLQEKSNKHKRRAARGISTAKETLWFEQILNQIQTNHEELAVQYYRNPILDEKYEVIPWSRLPVGIHPKDGHLPLKRIQNKRHQVENLAIFLQSILRDGDVVVEFCAGSGYVALPLACQFPKCSFVLLDMKQPSLDIALERIELAGLKNVSIFCGRVEEFKSAFDVGIALHACGEATDMVLDKCLAAQAAYVLAPCCVGKIKHSQLEYPRSKSLQDAISRSEYEVLAKAADFGHSGQSALAINQTNINRRKCKSVLETDRNKRASEMFGYSTAMYIMHPFDATPKNDILVGLPRHRSKSSFSTFLSPQDVNDALYGISR